MTIWTRIETRDAFVEAFGDKCLKGEGMEFTLHSDGRISEMGNRNLRRLLYLGSVAQVSSRRRGKPSDGWLWRIIQRKRPKQAAIALANRMARTAYALLRDGTEFQVGKAI